MRAIEIICLQPSNLSGQMEAMRTWLDEHHFEPSSFSCQKRKTGDRTIVISVRFNAAQQAEAFADHFGGRAVALLCARDGRVKPSRRAG